MNRFILLAVVLRLLNHGANMATAWDDKDFFSYCPPQPCGNGPEIRFPLWIESSNASSSPCCGTTCTKLVCSSNNTILLLDPILGASKVIAVDYKNATMKIIPLIGYSSACPIEELTEAARNQSEEDYYCNNSYDSAMIVHCSREVTITDAHLHNFYGSGVAGPIPCLRRNPDGFTYLVLDSLPLHLLPSDCKVVSKRAVPIPYANRSPSTFKEKVEAIFSHSEMTISWTEYPRESNPALKCTDCEEPGHRCAFSLQRNQTFCMPKPKGIIPDSNRDLLYDCTTTIVFT